MTGQKWVFFKFFYRHRRIFNFFLHFRIQGRSEFVEARIVPDINFRSGRRVQRIDGKADGELRVTKLNPRDRKGTLPTELISHPRLKDAERILLGDGGAAMSDV